MVKIIELIAEKRKKNEEWVSYEYFPPRSAAGAANLEARFDRMREAAEPLFVDMTWGAGGSTSELTLELTLKLKKRGLEPNMHLTCTNVAKENVAAALQSCRDAGVQNIVALRGDPPLGQDKWEATEGGFSCALDLVKFIRAEHGDYFNLSVAGYPEGHPDTIMETDRTMEELSPGERVRCRLDENGNVCVCPDDKYVEQLAYLKAKVEAGADMIITQMFFDVGTFAAFVSACRQAGITCPIVPGIMVIQAAGGFKKMTRFCKTRLPSGLAKKVEALAEDDVKLKDFGVSFGVEMCNQLRALAAPGLHFYTLNLEKSTLAIVDQLGLSTKKKGCQRETSDPASHTKAHARQRGPGFATVAALSILIVAVIVSVRANARP